MQGYYLSQPIDEAPCNTLPGIRRRRIHIDHPDILDFIILKQTPTGMTNFNLSVGMTHSFMQALVHRRIYALINSHIHKPKRRLPAQLLFDRLVEAARHTNLEAKALPSFVLTVGNSRSFLPVEPPTHARTISQQN
jgi:hypothetical protein